MRQIILLCLGYLVLSAGSAAIALEQEPLSFDFAHVNLMLQYFESPSQDLVQQIAATGAARHLKRHSECTGYYPPEASELDITADLLKKPPDQATLEQVRDLARYANAHISRQQSCFKEAIALLPPEAVPGHPLHVTYGYDIGVAMDGHASLNFAHQRFLDDPEEIWFYCIHEMHHAGVMQLHPMPRVASIDTVESLLGFVRYATFLEGFAVHAARDARRAAGALGNDPDYIALQDTGRLEQVMHRYWKLLSLFEAQKGAPLGDPHWQVIEEMSSGDRLWYVTGAAMAAAIEDSLGREALLDIIREGPDAFFKAYAEAE